MKIVAVYKLHYIYIYEMYYNVCDQEYFYEYILRKMIMFFRR